jgi:uncharacterized membrane protein
MGMEIVFLLFMGYCMWFFGFRGYGWPRRRYRLDPLDIARARYARGEISKVEFEEIKRSLDYA